MVWSEEFDVFLKSNCFYYERFIGGFLGESDLVLIFSYIIL